MNLNLLEEMYLAHSPSFDEFEMFEIVTRELDKMGIKYEVDEYLQIYSIKENTPLLSAHMDQVGVNRVAKIVRKNGLIYGGGIVKSKLKTVKKKTKKTSFKKKIKKTPSFAYGNIGADDKNGVFIALAALAKAPNTSFIFSTGEEAGGNIGVLLEKVDVSKCLYGIVLDRKGNGDIIGLMNDYCTKTFEKAVHRIGLEFGYEPSQGIFSDADALSNYISCVNVSVGYYNAHTEQEYTVIRDLKKALRFTLSILWRVKKNFAAPDKKAFDDYWYYSGYKSYKSAKRQWVKGTPITNDDAPYYNENLFYYCPVCGLTYYEDDIGYSNDGFTACCPECATELERYDTVGTNSLATDKMVETEWQDRYNMF